MGMKKGQKQYGRIFTEKILELRTQGLCHSEIANELGVTWKIVRNAIWRETDRQRKLAAGELPKCNRGRPRTKPMTTMEELQKRNKELEMENELLKKYHEELRR